MARVYRFGLRARRWAAIPMPEVDLKPNQPHPLTAGRYLIEFREPNRIPIKVPIVIEVDQRWDHRLAPRIPKSSHCPLAPIWHAKSDSYQAGGLPAVETAKPWLPCPNNGCGWNHSFSLHDPFHIRNTWSFSITSPCLSHSKSEHAPALQDHQGTMMPLQL